MADLNPLGSEKLQGMDKINRILEIARYNEPSQNVNESKADYTIQLADGKFYGIVNEKNGYIVKSGINESEMEYREPMQNRKYHRSYSQAMKQINLLAGELNRIHEHAENINMIGEQKKFVLKTPEAKMSDMGDAPEALPSPEPAPEEGGEDLDLGLDLDTPEGEEELDLDMDLGDDLPEPKGDDDEDVSFKMIQKLTGKLGQKLRTLDSQDGLSSEDIKYVLNSVISAVNLENLSEEDLEDVLANFEDEEIDYGVEGELDIEAGDEEGDELDLDLDLGDEEELSEGNFFLRSPETGMYSDEMDRFVGDDDYFDFEYDEEDVIDFDDLMSKLPDNQKIFTNDDTGRKFFNMYKDKFPDRPYKLRKRKMSPIDGMLDEEELSEGNFFLRSPETGMYSDEMDRFVGDDDYFDFEYDEEDVMDFDDLMSKLPDNQKIFTNDDTGRKFFNMYKDKFPDRPYKLRKRKMSPIDGVLDEVFTESKIDKVLSKYFVISEEEKKDTDNKNVMRFITEKVNKAKVKSELKEMSETLEQELTSEFIMKENKGSKFLGKTNKNNLVFEVDGKQLKVSPNGELL